MKKMDKFKLGFIRNWKLPGKIRLARYVKPSTQFKSELLEGIIFLEEENIGIFSTGNSYIENTILQTGTYENEINKLIRMSLRPGAIALDIGANIGLQSIRMSQEVGSSGNILAFEPIGHIRKKLKANLYLNNISNVDVLPIALSDSTSEEFFNIEENIWNQGTFSLDNKGQGNANELIKIHIGDSISEIKVLKSLSLIKIDVEGHEFRVIKGLKNTIERFLPRIIFEYDSNYWKRTNNAIQDCLDFFKSLNYKLFQIEDMACLPININTIKSGNIFCLPLSK